MREPRHQRPNHALQRTRPSHHCCNRGVPRAGSLSLGRWAFPMRVVFRRRTFLLAGLLILLATLLPLRISSNPTVVSWGLFNYKIGATSTESMLSADFGEEGYISLDGSWRVTSVYTIHGNYKPKWICWVSTPTTFRVASD
jgi:hypothetical protein